MDLKRIAMRHLAGVGNMAEQFEEWTGYAYHVRRRLTADEQARVGGAVDYRGTEEGARRYNAVKALLPVAAVQLAMEELAGAK